MSKKYTKDEYFAAASAQGVWATQDIDRYPIFEDDACRLCDAPRYLFENLWDEAYGIAYAQDPLPGMDGNDIAFLASQIGCEKSGL